MLLRDASESCWLFGVGPIPGGTVAYLRQLAASPPWPGWVLDGDPYVTAEQPRITWRHVDGRRTVHLYRAATYFGTDASAETCREAWALLAGALTGRHRTPVAPTPATTGRYLLGNLWHEHGLEYAPLGDPSIAELIRSTAPQGRVEVYDAGRAGGAGLVKYDARLAYLALAQQCELPVGTPRHVDAFTGDPWAPARWLVEFRAPARSGLVGRVSVRQPDGSLAWPERGRHVAWVDGAELHELRRAGWWNSVIEGWVWPDKRRALRRWGAAIEAEWFHAARLPVAPEVKGALQHAWRAIALHAIGALHGSPFRVLKRTAPGEQPPPGITAATPDDPTDPATCWSYVVERPPRMPELVHPEWSAHLWARMRVRLLQRLDNVPRRELVAAVLDAVYVTRPQPDWPDRGRVGDFKIDGQWQAFPPLATVHDLYDFTREGVE